jgi:hypothetical protein
MKVKGGLFGEGDYLVGSRGRTRGTGKGGKGSIMKAHFIHV